MSAGRGGELDFFFFGAETGGSKQGHGNSLIFVSLLFWISLFFLPFKEFLDFLSVFRLFSRDFRGSEETKNLCFFGGFPWVFSRKKKQGKEDQGCPPIDERNPTRTFSIEFKPNGKLIPN